MPNYKIKDNLKIAISGFSGCGNTTVSNMLADKLGIPCINYTFRSLSEELNIPFSEIVEESKNNFEYDKKVDSKQIELANKGACVLGSRLAVWLLDKPDLRIFLTANEHTRALRIQRREGGNIEDIKAFTRKRDVSDSSRYLQLYNIDNTSYGFVDLVIDTEQNTPDKICNIIIKILLKKNLIK